MKPLIIVFILLSSIFCHAQPSTTAFPTQWTNRYHDIMFPFISDDGKYVGFIKRYERRSDTFALVNMKTPDSIIYQRSGARAFSVAFSSDNMLFMLADQDAELLQLTNMNILAWKNVKQGIYVRSLKQIVIHQNDDLLILSPKGKLIKKISGIVTMKELDGRVFYIKSDGDQFVLSEWRKDGSVSLFKSEMKNMSVAYAENEVFFILVKPEQEQFGKLVFLNLAENISCTLKEPFKDNIQSAFIRFIQNGNYYVRIIQKGAPHDKLAVDIWYANDPQLEKKAFRETETHYSYLIWNTTFNTILSPDNQSFTHHVYIGGTKYLLSFDAYEGKDFSSQKTPFIFHRYNFSTNVYDKVVKTSHLVYTDIKGKYLLYTKDKHWEILELETMMRDTIPVSTQRRAYFIAGEDRILIEDMDRIVEYDISKKKLTGVELPPGFRAEIIGGTLSNLSPGLKLFQSFITLQRPLLIKMYDNENNRYALASYDGKKLIMHVAPTGDLLDAIALSKSGNHIAYVRSNITKPPSLMLNRRTEGTLVYQSNRNDSGIAEIRTSILTYKNSKGISLKGTLIYPRHFEPSKKYPVIVSIYEKQRYLSNVYLKDGMAGPAEGFNPRYFIERGYFVYFPDIIYDNRGPGRSALDCVESSLTPLLQINQIEASKIGLLGHSHGGYQTNFIATQSNKFAAYVAGSGNSDLVRSFNSFNYNFNSPFYWQFEDGQYRMPGSFTDFKDLYIDNSPVYHAEKLKRPILLWTGTRDFNIHWDQTMQFYLALRRNRKPVIAVFYPEDEHSLRKIKNIIDLYERISQWFDFHLKGDDQPWISKGM